MKHICYIIGRGLLNFAADKNKNDMHKPNNYTNDIAAHHSLMALPHKTREPVEPLWYEPQLRILYLGTSFHTAKEDLHFT